MGRPLIISKRMWFLCGTLLNSSGMYGCGKFHYLRDVFRSLPAQPTNALAELTADAWAATRRKAEAASGETKIAAWRPAKLGLAAEPQIQHMWWRSSRRALTYGVYSWWPATLLGKGPAGRGG